MKNRIKRTVESTTTLLALLKLSRGAAQWSRPLGKRVLPHSKRSYE